MMARVSSVEQNLRMAARNAERVYIVKDERPPLEAANDFELEQEGAWDPRTIGLCTDLDISRNWHTSRLNKEMIELKKNPVRYCRAAPRADNIHGWTAVIDGPKDTVYEGGTFFLQMIVPMLYPFRAPSVKFITRIYHCNINRHGVVNIDILQDRWSSSITIAKILEEIVAILCQCKPENAWNENIAEQYLHNRKEYDATARTWTLRFAQ